MHGQSWWAGQCLSAPLPTQLLRGALLQPAPAQGGLCMSKPWRHPASAGHQTAACMCGQQGVRIPATGPTLLLHVTSLKPQHLQERGCALNLICWYATLQPAQARRPRHLTYSLAATGRSLQLICCLKTVQDIHRKMSAGHHDTCHADQ